MYIHTKHLDCCIEESVRAVGAKSRIIIIHYSLATYDRALIIHRPDNRRAHIIGVHSNLE